MVSDRWDADLTSSRATWVMWRYKFCLNDIMLDCRQKKYTTCDKTAALKNVISFLNKKITQKYGRNSVLYISAFNFMCTRCNLHMCLRCIQGSLVLGSHCIWTALLWRRILDTYHVIKVPASNPQGRLMSSPPLPPSPHFLSTLYQIFSIKGKKCPQNSLLKYHPCLGLRFTFIQIDILSLFEWEREHILIWH